MTCTCKWNTVCPAPSPLLITVRQSRKPSCLATFAATTNRCPSSCSSATSASRKLSSGDGVASQLRTQRLALTETLESQLSRAASVGDDEVRGWVLRGCASAAECYDGS